MVVLLVFVLLKKPSKQKSPETKFTDQEINEIISEWKPDPLELDVTPLQELDAVVPVLDSARGAQVVVNSKNVVNLAAINPFGLLGEKDLEDAAIAALKKYGCGSCGPRGFYGSIDVHVALEKALGDAMKCEQTILYSSSFATVASVIPTFAKKDDVIYCDRGVNFAIATGLNLSRSTIHYFPHNDHVALGKLLEEHQSKLKDPQAHRRFLVVEGLYVNYGDIVPLAEMVALKNKYCLYLMVDESHSFGVLGKTGGGVCELFNIPRTDIDIATGSLGNIGCSVGGFCSGSNSVVTHQRLNGSGYVFSASLPPYLSAVAMVSLKRLKEDQKRRAMMLDRTALAYKLLGASKSLSLRSTKDSPIVHLEWRNSTDDLLTIERRLQAIVDLCLERGVLITRSKYVSADKLRPAPSIRVIVPASLSESEARDALQTIVDVADEISKRN